MTETGSGFKLLARMSTAVTRERDDDDEPTRDAKRPRNETNDLSLEDHGKHNTSKTYQLDNLLPPSHVLLNLPASQIEPGASPKIREEDVGISEYISSGVSPIEGIIKQRYDYCRLLG